jgi:hypothetical protein
MTLRELFEAVKEKHLSKTQLEEYRDELSSLFAAIHLEMADLEKAEALFIVESKLSSDVAKKRVWNATPQGQRLIELKHYSKGAEKVLSSLKSRLYSVY